MNDIEQRLRTLVAKRLDLPEESLLPESRFVEDLGADSLDVVEMVMALEAELGFDIPDDHAGSLTTFGLALAYARAHPPPADPEEQAPASSEPAA